MKIMNRWIPRIVLFLAISVAGLANQAVRGEDFPPDQIEFFEKRVRPLLIEHCYSCHSDGAEKIQAGLQVDSRRALLSGGDSGASIVIGNADASLLVSAIRYEEYEMPPSGKLPEADINTLVEWINMGAPWGVDAGNVPAPGGTIERAKFDLAQRKASHWVWQPISRPSVPEVKNSSWPITDIDRFILNKLEVQGLAPALPVDRRGLARRLAFDIVGLPPTPEQVDQFVQDTSPVALDRYVDALLASPHFGERWGRHWLDLVRYAESRGHEFDYETANAYQYRDYVIRAFNADIPYDQFVREHIAGDLIQPPRLSQQNGFNESVLGTGFWFFGEWAHSPVDIRKDETDRFDNMIDVMSKTFLGVTVSCARCHDHKFDAISTRDYYSLCGFLQSSDYRQVRFESIAHNQQVADQLDALDNGYRKAIRDAIGGLFGDTQVPELLPNVNSDQVRMLVDYSNLSTENYLQDGLIFGKRPRTSGEAYLELHEGKPSVSIAEYSAAVNDAFWDIEVNVSESRPGGMGALDPAFRSGRTLRTPSFESPTGRIFCLVAGAGQIFACVDSHRTIAGPLHGETLRNVELASGSSNAPHWVELNLQRYAGHRFHLEFTPAKNQTFAVLKVVDISEGAGPPALATDLNAMATRLLELAANNSNAQSQLQSIANQWHSDRERLRQTLMPDSALAVAMLDGSGEDDRVLVRGSSANPGDLVPRRFLEAIDGDQPLSIGVGSGRLELAQRINEPTNPLTSRVIVNRIWHHLMGRGIVASTDDFGVLGQAPTHRELLDYLATYFNENGKSIKQVIRHVVLSQVYQMSSHSQPEAIAIDPSNRYWHHRSPKRLEAEVIRDSLLAASGALRPQFYGRSVPVHLTSFMEGRGRPGDSGPLDGTGRRSIYISVRRNFLSPWMQAFDTPNPFSTMGRRNVSNVPAQALILMNDPLVSQLSEQIARRAIATEPEDRSNRVNWFYEMLFARPATAEEASLATGYLDLQAIERGVNPDDLSLWSDLAHAMINTKEFIFLR